MIKKLRIKLIVASMISLLFVLCVIEGTIGVLSYMKIGEDADRILRILEENSGTFPMKLPFEHRKKKSFMSPEAPYESRYFSVLLNDKGEVIFINTEKIASINNTEATEYAVNVSKKQEDQGYYGNFRYLRYPHGDGEQIVFLDCRKQLDSFRNLLFNSFWVSVLGLSSVLVLMIYFSSKIVKPFSDNYEKQKRFITDAGHELKTPLTIIDADTEILEMDFGENEWLKDIRNQTKRLADLTNTLILLSRMEEGQKKDMEIEFPLSDIVEEEYHIFQSLAKVNGKKLQSNIVPMISMKGDEKAIRGLVTILLDNAIKYSDEEGEIEISLEMKKNRIHLSVFNTTKNISKEQVSHLFDRFYRADISRNSQIKGYGLGLSIAAATVASHKGKIIAETKDEHSLTITVTFPI